MIKNTKNDAMKTRSIIVITALLILSAGTINAQVGNILRNRINRAINKEVENKIDTAISQNEKEAQKNQQKNENENEGRSRGLGGILGNGSDIKHNDNYDFTGRIYMQTETYDKKDVKTTDFYTYYNTNTLNAGIEAKVENPDNKDEALPVEFIFDNDNRCFIMLMENEGSKTGIISTIPDDSTLAAASRNRKAKGEEKPVVTKTGNSKVIAGYRCDEYKVTEPGEDGYANVWMTRDLKIKADRRNWGKAGIPTFYNLPGLENSTILAMEDYDKDNKLVMKMETKEINENFKHSISTEGYPLIKMNFGQAGRK
jgi:hypothetical protein